MSRPYIMTADRGLQPDQTARLYAMRDTMRPSQWRLCWSHPDSPSYVMNEGECSAVYYPRLSDAVAAGQRDYGQRALAVGW